MTNGIDASGLRRKYVEAFNSTMVEIWKERVVLTGAIDTGNLYAGIVARSLQMDMSASSVQFSWQFPEYGIYVERGTGREVYRGNPGDIGRPKVRKAHPWQSRAYYSSVMNMKEFMAASLGLDALRVISNAFRNTISGVL